jgi:hypothetical protein
MDCCYYEFLFETIIPQKWMKNTVPKLFSRKKRSVTSGPNEYPTPLFKNHKKKRSIEAFEWIDRWIFLSWERTLLGPRPGVGCGSDHKISVIKPSSGGSLFRSEEKWKQIKKEWRDRDIFYVFVFNVCEREVKETNVIILISVWIRFERFVPIFLMSSRVTPSLLKSPPCTTRIFLLIKCASGNKQNISANIS